MTQSIGNLDRLPPALRSPAVTYADMVRQVTNGKAIGLAFYGLCVGGRFNPAVQPARNVLVVEKIELPSLRKLSQQGVKLARTGIAAPIVMTPKYITASLDTFPLELLEIQQQHVQIFGDEYFADLPLKDEHVRMQCERELKTALVGMRQGLLRTAGRDRALHDVVVDATEGLLRVLRGILWLRDQREPSPSDALVGEVEKTLERKLPGICAGLDANTRHGWESFEALYADVNTLGELIDAW